MSIHHSLILYTEAANSVVWQTFLKLTIQVKVFNNTISLWSKKNVVFIDIDDRFF